MKKMLMIFVALGLATAVLALLTAFWIHRYMQTPMALSEVTIFVVEPGSSLRSVSRQLHSDGLVSEPEFFHWYSRLLGKAGALRAGEYTVMPGTTPSGLLKQLISGEVLMHSITIVEGWNAAQMRAALHAHPAVQVSSETIEWDALMTSMGAEGVHPEGQFFPDTYRFPRGTSETDLLRQAYKLMQKKLASAWSRRDSDLVIKSPYEALILASIIEKETALDSERRQISGVFSRRLAKGMRLQTDPTVIYGIGESYDGNIRRRDLDTDTPYNTYTRAGLPPTPIALPGEASLVAAVQPDDGSALYFVATGNGDGGHYFSATLEQHNKAVRRYLETIKKRRNPE